MQHPENLKIQEQTRQKRIVYVITGLFAAVMLGLGLLAIFSGHFAGTTKRGQLFSADGLTAQWMGGVQISLGMMILTIVMPNKTAALRWGVIWAILFLSCLFAAICSK
ncbi:hypothetical protein QN372_07765 [Undibacterium sp. RTI2.1]|uniref:hypothetical protein n=2 Tax=Pseudomonadota TaxID=1224 RepID=UPI002AB4018B|nr:MULTISPECIES: hypothetical protein [unclassified Undibacterium]MDY7540482.1 hypothetical protein [Undibacterium sp. 5I1]MEB0030636.1 hypothetical protein [Undibacterium sp. RTI2.1]MEB0116576.1 hypothetical protein [Undibacterium sp. RTI2.2]MEB0230057.1 hypothetical protein [Undibacterium sp. 10I3]MEB0257741.1 hypothetical protein [Undibacterium sp. 5I1]